MKNYRTMSASLPRPLADRIDTERGDISRSRFMQRMLEGYYYNKDKQQEAVGAANISK